MNNEDLKQGLKGLPKSAVDIDNPTNHISTTDPTSSSSNGSTIHELHHLQSTSQKSRPENNECENSPASADQKLTLKKHNTRGQNGIKKRKLVVYPPEDIQQIESEEDLIDICASILACLDRRACARALMQDSNAVFEEILFPMSFPWTHQSAPFMKIPRDIEDMPGIMEIGCIDPELDKLYGKLEIFNNKYLPLNSRVAARRSDDPGVIKFTTISDPSLARLESITPLNLNLLSESALKIPGELSLHVFQGVQARQNALRDVSLKTTKSISISIRLASTSSKRTVLEAPGKGQHPIILPAWLPREVQIGKRKGGLKAYEAAKYLGSYNCRKGQSIPPRTGDGRNRAWVGRSRLVWTKQDHPSGMMRRTLYRSLLTGERLESNVHKRPMMVKVGIQVGGRLLASCKPMTKKARLGLDAALFSLDPNLQFSYSSRVVNDALNQAIVGVMEVGDQSRCSLNVEKFYANIMEDIDSDRKVNVLEEILTPICIKSKTSSNDEYILSIKPPRLDCTATEDGILYVVCSRPGIFDWSKSSSTKESKTSIARQIVEKICSDFRICSICYKNTITESKEEGIRICPSCADLESTKGKNEKWYDNQPVSEVDDQVEDNERSQSCAVCMLDCGYLRYLNKSKIWIHDVCRLWVSLGDDALSRVYEKGVCHLCSNGSSVVVRCAASNCRVSFHPMCAIITSKSSQLQNNVTGKGQRENDVFLCTQYKLSMLQTSYRAEPCDSNPMFGKTAIVPVAFCGYHNPKRQADHFGLYPGCAYLTGAMRIPPRREGSR